ncbi:extracellular solute-binding protein [Nonomuraea muscovyensis]|uniref:Putative aldouronate transport system substrate-binding protein n=1 Tax=Nonomuraea muscovyensis TaxID=1124761 RepID=A0A7X0C4M0_9ACTN|nr:extracellular solute-binding protein [Nonomuraea muscovyensis]MBB6348417.1 putative aldouronate transport system substrate-binding protein [Nonomuraea muscovyensis]MDF2708719.1 transporter substrate-binding protein [Nonomuraea muscovyensis]
MSASRRRLTAGVVTLTAALLASACSGGGDAPAADPNTLTIMSKLFGTAPDPKGEMHQAVEKFLGKKLQVTWVPNAEYTDKLNVTLASDNLPQVMVVDPKLPAFVKSAQAGAFWDLTDKIDKYPNLKPADERTALNSSINGKIYGLYRMRPLLRSAIVIRKDWLKKVGLDEPETVDDLYEIAKAFTEKDPDGNGKKDTFGLIIPKWPGNYASASPYDVIETWFGAPNGWGERDGKIVPGFDTPEFLEANRWLKKMVDGGMVNPDFATLDAAKWNEPFHQNKGGMIIDVNIRSRQVLDLFYEDDKETYGDKVAMVGNLKRSDGQKFSYPFTGYADVLAVSKQSVRTEADLDNVLKTLDKLASKEGQVLVTNGIEGRNFKVENGDTAALINEDDPAVKTVQDNVDDAFIQLSTKGTVDIGGIAYQRVPSGQPYKDMVALQKKLMAEDLKTAVHNVALPVVAPAAVAKGAQLDTIIPDARIKYLSGTFTEEQLKAEIKRWYDSGGTQVAAEINDLVGKLGQ